MPRWNCMSGVVRCSQVMVIISAGLSENLEFLVSGGFLMKF